jgi:2'-5' RNA ligase
MRLFTGLAIPPSVIALLETVMNQLRPLAPLRWSPPENLHITTKFIGEWPETRLPELEDSLGKMPRPAPFILTIARFGFLPNPHHPKIFFAGVHGDGRLNELAKNTEETLALIGVKKETHPYTPHLTLARVGKALPPAHALRERIAHLNPEFGAFEATEFHLYQSSNSAYTKLSTYPLARAES